MKKTTNNWNIEPFLKWWETKQGKFHCGQFSEKEVAYSAWLAGIDYYIDNVEEKPLPYPSPTEEAASLARLASMDDLYDDDDDDSNESLDLKQCKHYRVKKGGEWSKYGHYDIYYKCLDCNSIFYQDQTSTDEWNALKEKENKQ